MEKDNEEIRKVPVERTVSLEGGSYGMFPDGAVCAFSLGGIGLGRIPVFTAGRKADMESVMLAEFGIGPDEYRVEEIVDESEFLNSIPDGFVLMVDPQTENEKLVWTEIPLPERCSCTEH